MSDASNLAAQGRKALKKGQAAAAIEHFVRAVELEPRNLQLRLLLGRAYYNQERYDEALSCFREVLALDCENLEALRGSGYSLHLLGQLDEAIYQYMRFLALDSKDVYVHCNLVAALSTAGRPAEAIEAGERALSLFPEHSGLRLQLANTAFYVGDLAAARDHVEHAIKLDPKNAPAHKLRADLLAAEGKNEDAIKSYRAAIVLRPDDGEAYLGLAMVYNRLQRYAEYGEAAERARAILGESGNQRGLRNAYWDLGWANYKLGKWAESIEASRRSIEIDGSVATVHFNLGLALLHVGDVASAREAYECGLELNDVGSLKNDGIDDLREALEINPRLAGARAILSRLEAEFTQAAARRRSRVAGYCHG